MAWIRIDTDFFTNDEVCDVTHVTRYAVTSVIAYVKAHGSRGEVRATPKQIARSMDVPIKNIQEALATSFFSVEDKTIQVVKWQKFQIDPTHAERQKKYRNKNDLSDASDSHSRHVTRVTPTVTVTGTVTPTEEKASAKKKATAFKRPTLDEIQKYIDKLQYENFDVNKFHDFYESKGWMVGKNKMRDWKAAVRNWRRSDGDRKQTQRQPVNYSQAEMDEAMELATQAQERNG
ncbi:MAG: hypothetical protein GY869_14670 [Planctomycetes bacterium]|nr:hypothetical protein [Planctomycetota bacterium]